MFLISRKSYKNLVLGNKFEFSGGRIYIILLKISVHINSIYFLQKMDETFINQNKILFQIIIISVIF